MVVERRISRERVVRKDHVNEINELLGGDLPTVSLFSVYKPKAEWFSPEISDIHGVSHAARVLVLQELLARAVVRQGVQLDTEALRWGAAIHDVGREDDFWGYNHGVISARWVQNNLEHLITSESLETLTYIVTWHEPEDEDAPEMTPELAVLKDADGLDRGRVSYAHVDPTMLRHKISRGVLLNVAERLLMESERDVARFKNPFRSVMNAGVKLGVILDK